MDTKLVRKGLTFIMVSLIIMFASIILSFVVGFLVGANPNLAGVITIVGTAISIIAAVFTIVGYFFGKKGGVKKFAIAFWFEIVVLILTVLNFVFGFIPNIPPVFASTFTVINIALEIAAALLACLACKDVKPELKGLAIASLVVLAVGYGFTIIGIFVPVLIIIGSLTLLAGEIVYMVLVCKTRNLLA